MMMLPESTVRRPLGRKNVVRHWLLIDKDMHIFGEKQADINWENEEVRQEIYKVLRWWLDRGLDGFRVGNCCPEPG